MAGGADRSSAHRLAHEPNVWLATVRPDGSPHLTPVWFVFEAGGFWIGTGAASAKVRNLRANPRVSVCLQDGNDPLVAEGRARVVPPPVPAAVVAAFRAKYDWDVSVAQDADVGDLALVHVEVDRWLLGTPPTPAP
jgi:PPOX class probable F420-dependent enzyme